MGIIDCERNEAASALLPRWAIVLLAALVALLFQLKPSSAQIPNCPIAGCGDKPAPSCGVCKTINGTYTVYKTDGKT